jgi:hypothetical protein
LSRNLSDGVLKKVNISKTRNNNLNEETKRLSRQSSVTSIERSVLSEDVTYHTNEKGKQVKRTLRIIKIIKRTVKTDEK